MKIRLKSLSQQTIVITGGSSGIGLCTARMAADEGARVVIISRNEDALSSVVEQIKASGGKADYIVADVGDRDAMRDAVDTVIERHGGFDTWVNNAGVGIYATLEETSDEDHHRVFQTNYWGVVYGSLEALRHLKDRGGALINIGSISSDMPAPILSAYTASKFAVKGFTDSLRLELMHEKAPVSVTLIKPSGIHTPFGEHAKNYMTARSQVPPPVYHPKLVAKAILHSAEHPTRDVLVGASGWAQTTMAKIMPGVSDRIFSWAFYKTVLDKDLPKRNGSGLHSPGSDGKELGDQDDPILEVSPYTAAQLHPKTTFAIGAGVAALAAALIIKRKDVGKLIDA